MATDFLPGLRVQRPQDLLREIVDAGGASAASMGGPTVRVCVGPTICEGVPVKIEDIGGQPWLALYEPRAGGTGTEAITTVPLNSVLTVTLLDVRSHLKYVTSPGAWSISGEGAPSRLQTERNAAALKAKVDWSGEVENPVARVMVDAVVKALGSLLTSFDADPLAKESLAKVEGFDLKFVPGASFDSNRNGNRIQLSFGAKLDLNKLNSQLQTSLEKQL